MMDNYNHNDPAFAFMKLKKEVQGVKHTFVFPRQTKPQNLLEEVVNQFVSGLSDYSPTKIYIYMVKGGVITCITDQFVIGCVINSDANPTLVEMILDRIALNLNISFETFKTDMKSLHERIKERIEGLNTTTVNISLDVTPFNVGGYIAVTTTPKQKEQLQSEIQCILTEEIPFFCRQDIALTVSAKTPSAHIVLVPGSTL